MVRKIFKVPINVTLLCITYVSIPKSTPNYLFLSKKLNIQNYQKNSQPTEHSSRNSKKLITYTSSEDIPKRPETTRKFDNYPRDLSRKITLIDSPVGNKFPRRFQKSTENAFAKMANCTMPMLRSERRKRICRRIAKTERSEPPRTNNFHGQEVKEEEEEVERRRIKIYFLK